MDGDVAKAREALLSRFRWQDGHADVWHVFADGAALAAVVDGLIEPWRDRGVTRVVGVESRGFLLGAPAALALGVGFVAVRKEHGVLPGPKHAVTADADYRGVRHRLRMQAILNSDDRVLMVDDWAEQGSQASGVSRLVQAAGATFLGLSVLVDQLDSAARDRLGVVTAIAMADDLGPSG
jgi:adenine phosphoribosyltransferase